MKIIDIKLMKGWGEINEMSTTYHQVWCQNCGKITVHFQGRCTKCNSKEKK